MKKRKEVPSKLSAKALQKCAVGQDFSRPRVAIYARSATFSQNALQHRVRICRKWASRHRALVDHNNIFTDSGVSGLECQRPGLRALKAALKANRVGVVLVSSPTSLSRSISKCLCFVDREILRRGKKCIFVDADIEVTDRLNGLRPLVTLCATLMSPPVSTEVSEDQ
jgi:hypothetical protein